MSDSQGMNNRWGRAVAWLAFLLTLALAIIAVVLQLRSPTGASWRGGVNYLTLIHPIVSALVGAVIIARKGNHVVGWLFCLSGLFWGHSHLAYSYGAYSSRSGDLLWESQILWSSTWAVIVAFGLAPALILYLFPNGHLTSARWKTPFAAASAAIALGAMGSAFAPGPIEDLPNIDNPYGIEGAIGETMKLLRDLSWPVLLLSIAAGVWSLRSRARHGTPEERQQIKWISLAGMISVTFVLAWGITEMTGNDPGLLETINGLVVPLLPIAVGIAILRYRLYDIDLLINRALVYTGLSAILGTVYLGAVVLLQGLLGPITAESDLAVAASTLAVAGLFGPLRTQVQRFIDRRFYRSKYDAAQTLQHFSTRLRDQVDLKSLSHELVTVVGSTMQPRHASLWLRNDVGAESLQPVYSVLPGQILNSGDDS